MSTPTNPHTALRLALLMLALVIAGCSNPDAPTSTPTTSTGTGSAPQNAGEPPAPPPPTAAAQSPAQLQPTPLRALALFTGLYVNWTYRTLTSHQRILAAISIGSARLSEQQAAAATQTDTTIRRAAIWNHGQLISATHDLANPGMWVLVTREQTGGDSQYEGLPAAYHVTLAELTQLPGGWAISQWQPQS